MLGGQHGGPDEMRRKQTEPPDGDVSSLCTKLRDRENTVT